EGIRRLRFDDAPLDVDPGRLEIRDRALERLRADPLQRLADRAPGRASQGVDGEAEDNDDLRFAPFRPHDRLAQRGISRLGAVVSEDDGPAHSRISASADSLLRRKNAGFDHHCSAIRITPRSRPRIAIASGGCTPRSDVPEYEFSGL